jgi:serine/threonine protein kinase
MDSRDDLSHVESLENELSLLQSLQHSRIVRYLGHERVDGKLYPQISIRTADHSDKLLVFCEYMPGGSLATTIRQFGALDEKAIALHTRQILEVCRFSLQYLNILGTGILTRKPGVPPRFEV